MTSVNNWKTSFDKDDIYSSFVEHRDLFRNNGGDCEKLVSLCKIAHSDRIFTQQKEKKKILSLEDFNEGFKKFVEGADIEEEEEEISLSEVVVDGLKTLITSYLNPKEEEEKTDYKNLMYI